ncbi:MAG: hypothetical protein QXM68_00655 [Candidatus Aenigmatarchaeota archaeon]|nr:hypothetical protein [Candidatus Aenigmarchaeota archaeon]
MDEKEIVKTFLDMGVQLTKDSLALIKTNPEIVISEVKNMKVKPFFLTYDYVNSILNKHRDPKQRIKILKQWKIQQKTVKIDDYNFHLTKKYEKIRDIFISYGINAISINKINENTREFSAIGLIFSKTPKSFVLEDLTGEIEINVEGLMKNKLSEFNNDDVVAVSCIKERDKYFAKKLLHPDIPLDRNVKKLNENIEIELSLGENSFININDFDSPVMLDFDNINFLVIPRIFLEKIDKAEKEYFIDILKKRYMLPEFNPKISYSEDDFVMDELPDFIISDIGERASKNYKGTTILLLDENGFKVNLHTREVNEI